ncbi:MAG: SMP-30/gluconolactonase/LRE family protein [Acidimicrobiia bacterium]|nr:SMP-30/gluconolactonase/LRE family protein [Acidimicrobiia bacterium]
MSPSTRKAIVLLALAAMVAVVLPAMPVGAAGHVEIIHEFESNLFAPCGLTPGDECPEGVAVDKRGNVYVSLDALGEIRKFTPSGEMTTLVDFESSGALGLAVDAQGNVYVAREDDPNNGVYKVDRRGHAERLPGTEAIVLPNALAFDKRGNLYVSETFSFDPDTLETYDDCGGGKFGDGAIWRIPKRGETELWLRDELLTGLCLPNPIPFPIGANGIAYRHGAIYVANTEKSTIVRIPVEKDGSAGTPEVVATVTGFDPELGPPALDGIALDVHGNIFAAVINQSRIVRIGHDGSETDVATSADGLDFPASLAFGTGTGARKSMFVTNYAIGPPPVATGIGPSLIEINVGVPGMPLP